MANVLTVYKLNAELKSRGWGLEDFLTEYGYADENELREGLKDKITKDSKKVDRLIKQMKQNSKRKNKMNKNATDSSSEQPQANYKSAVEDSMKTPIPYTNVNVGELLKTAEKSVQSYEETEKAKYEYKIIPQKVLSGADISENNIEAENSENADTTVIEQIAEPTAVEACAETSAVETANSETTVADVETTDNENELEKLNNELQSINNQIDESERSIKGLYSRKRKVSKDVDEICQAIKRIENSLLVQKQKFERVYAEDTQIRADIESEKGKLKQLQLEKENHLSKIRELMSISLYCDEGENANKSFDYDVRNFEFSAADVTAKFTSFFEGDFEQSILDEFPVHELKKAARIILAAEQIEQADGSKVDLCFDSNTNLTGLLELMGRKVVISK